MISVIIPFKDSQDSIGKCIEHLLCSDYRSYEIIAVDDFSADSSPELVRSFEGVQLIKTSSPGPASARNTGAGYARGDILFFLDSDVLVANDTLSSLDKRFSNDNAEAVIGLYSENSYYSNFISRYKNTISNFTHLNSSTKAFSFWSGCGALRKELFDKTGGFSPVFKVPSVEDIEFGYRLRKEHKVEIVLDKELEVMHMKRYSFLDLIYSDLFRRAIPWTILMYEYSVFENDQDTKTENVLAVLFVWLSLLSALLLVVYYSKYYAYVFASSVILYLLSSFRILSYALKQDFVFFAAFIPMYYLTMFYSGLGFAAGTIIYLWTKLKPKKNHVL